MTGESVLEQARASLEEGDFERAREALRRAVEQDPGDPSALVDLGYLALGAGDTAEAAGLFRQALERDPGNVSALLAFSEIHRRTGRIEEAFEASAAASQIRPDDVAIALEGADLALELGRLDEAEAAFQRVRALDDDPAHEVYAHHGLIEVELRRERWRRALDLAVDATRVDRLGRTTDILAYAVSQVFGESERPAPERSAVEEALSRSRAEHRRLHAEAL